MCEKGTESIVNQIQRSKDEGLDLVELRLDRYLFTKETAADPEDVPADEVTAEEKKTEDISKDVPVDEVSTEEEKSGDTSKSGSDSIEVLVPIAEVTEDGAGDVGNPPSQDESEKAEEDGKPDEPEPEPSIEQLEELIRESPIPILCSVQRKENGGCFEGELDEKRAILSKIIEYSPTYLELELDDIQIDKTFLELMEEARKNSVKVIVSKYNAEGCYSEEEFDYVLRSMYEMSGDIYKICCNISSFTHLANIFGSAFEMRKEEKSFTYHGTGKLGNKCAQYAPLLGSVMAFCSLSKDEKVEKSLLDIKLLNEQWNILMRKEI